MDVALFVSDCSDIVSICLEKRYDAGGSIYLILLAVTIILQVNVVMSGVIY
jgi:hypothetical protein